VVAAALAQAPSVQLRLPAAKARRCAWRSAAPLCRLHAQTMAGLSCKCTGDDDDDDDVDDDDDDEQKTIITSSMD
jgi:hypothetical protein